MTTTTLPFKENCSKTLSGVEGTGLGNPSRTMLQCATDIDIVNNNLVYAVLGIQKTQEIVLVGGEEPEHCEVYFSRVCPQVDLKEKLKDDCYTAP